MKTYTNLIIIAFCACIVAGIFESPAFFLPAIVLAFASLLERFEITIKVEL